MVRKIIEILMSIICFVLQITLFKRLQIASVSPNLLIVLVASLGFMKGKREGVILGFISGFFVDLYYSQVMGVYTLLYMLIGYLNGFFKNEFFPEDIKLPMLLISMSDFVLNCLTYLIFFAFRTEAAFTYYLVNIVIPELVYTMLVSFVLYLLILKINQEIERYEKKSASKFG
ncbi:MAG: rod shape-determining protein MreD [Lachnospiraceae bacterium]